ncbi:MAG: serine hydrolase domain-containing protein [Bacteroidota bacterium]
MKLVPLSLLVCTLMIVHSCGQPPTLQISNPATQGLSQDSLQKMIDHFHGIVDDGQLAGIQTAIMRNDELVHFDTYGFANLEEQIPLTDSSIFRIFSMTKPIVSVALMQLYDQGKFKLEDPLHQYIPAFKNAQVYEEGNLRPATTPIRIVDLLTHTSGLSYGRGADTTLNNYYREARLWGSKDNEEFAERVSQIPLQFEPGTDWQYGVSTGICGRLIEVLSGQPLDDYLQQNIFDPLGMTDTHFQLPLDKVERFTVGYRWSDEEGLYIDQDQRDNRYTREVTLLNGGGGLVSTTQDYLAFCQMLLNKGQAKGQQILQASTVDLMLKDHLTKVKKDHDQLRLPPGEFGFGLGFAIRGSDYNKLEKVFGWGGAVGTYFKVDLEHDLCFVMMVQVSPYRWLGLRQLIQDYVDAAIIE